MTNIQKAKQVALAVETDEEDPVVAKLTASAKDAKTEGFEKAQEREIEQWRKKKVMETVNNEDFHTIETTWVFTKKIHASGKEKEKARLVARGFQDEMDEVGEVYAPTCSKGTMRLLLSLFAVRAWVPSVIDVTTAFLAFYKDIP